MEVLKFVIVGHVDHGKSTLIGRLLYDTNSLPPDKMEEVKRASNALGRETEFAYLLDHLEEERKQGITIDTTQVFFKSDKRRYVIIDAPGHVEFVQNMITGASQAEAALLIVDVQQGVQEQTKRHAYILSLLGIKQVVVVLNKMDLIQNEEAVYNKVKADIEDFLSTLGIKALVYIPISALCGDNVAEKSTDISWYNGPTFLESLDALSKRESIEEDSLILPIQDVYKIEDKRIIVGKIEAGKLHVDQKIQVASSKEETNVVTIAKFNEDITEAVAGESIGLITKDPIFIDRGDVFCEKDSAIEITDQFKANIFWMERGGFNISEKLTMRIATQEVSCQVKKISKRINSSSLELIEENAQELRKLEVGEVVIRTKKPVAVRKFSDLEGLGRFVFVRGENVCAGGIIV